MSDLTSAEKRKLERLFRMGSGYVLDFTNRTFGEFIVEHTGRDVFAREYPVQGSSKAWRLRTFWDIEPNHLVGKLINVLIDYLAESQARQQAEGVIFLSMEPLPGEAVLIDECRRIAVRLTQGMVVQEIDAIQAPVAEPDFETVAREARDAINRNTPEVGLDRLHTFVIKFVRTLCTSWGVEVNREKPLHSLFGEYVKKLRGAGHVESTMTERILKSSISTLESFNDVRNEQSLAHDNQVLNYEESLLIYNHVTATVRFLTRLEATVKAGKVPPEAAETPLEGDDIPF